MADDGRIALTDIQGVVRFWKDGQWIPLQGPCGRVTSVRFASTPSRDLATGAEDGSLCVLNTDHPAAPPTLNPSPVLSPRPSLHPITDLRFSPSARRIVASAAESPAILWMNDGTVAKPRMVGGDYHRVGKARFFDDHHLVTASGHGTARVWNVGAPQFPLTLGLTYPIRQLLLSPAFPYPVLGLLQNGGLRWYRMEQRGGQATPTEMIKPEARLIAGRWSDDGTLLALASATGLIQKWKVEHREFTSVLEETRVEGEVRALWWIGDRLLIERQDQEALLWSPGNTPTVLPESSREGMFAVNAATGAIAQGGEDLHLWYPGQPPIRIQRKAQFLAFSPDGSRLLLVSADNGVWVIDPKKAEDSGQRLLTNGERVRSYAWSADGRRVAIGGDDLLAQIFTLPETVGAPLSAYERLRHQKPVTQVAFVGRRPAERLATLDERGTVQLWDVDRERVPEMALDERPVP